MTKYWSKVDLGNRAHQDWILSALERAGVTQLLDLDNIGAILHGQSPRSLPRVLASYLAAKRELSAEGLRSWVLERSKWKVPGKKFDDLYHSLIPYVADMMSLEQINKALEEMGLSPQPLEV